MRAKRGLLGGMRVLALEPYYGGSHKAFLDGWISHSRHSWRLLDLPAYKWKWRMRHAPWTFAQQLQATGENTYDCIVTTDMLDVAQWQGLAQQPLAALPILVYFHENQLTYPVRNEHTRDLHFGQTNILSAAAATAVWFNSEYHRTSFLDAAADLLGRMPDYQPVEMVDIIRRKSQVCPPGVALSAAGEPRQDGPLHILWAARWEHDKNPEMFFDGLRQARMQGASFRLSVIGEQFQLSPGCFDRAQAEFAPEIVYWGFLPTRTDYEQALAEADLFVSTADHEFFGIAAAEAILAGCRPLLPNRLAYPDLLNGIDERTRAQVFYDGTIDDLAVRIVDLSTDRRDQEPWRGIVAQCQSVLEPLRWKRLAPRYDDHLEELVRSAPN